MKNKVYIKKDQLYVEPEGMTKLSTFKSELVIPLSHVKGATLDKEIMFESKGIKALGTDGLIGGYIGGTFKKDGEKTFFNASKGADTVVIQLDREEYVRLVLEVEDPERIIAEINNHI